MRPPRVAVVLLLAAVTAAAYGQTRGFGFVFDDEGVVLGSPPLREGISAGTVAWALSSSEHGNWFPLTRLSLLLDGTLFGVSPGPMHLVNAALHFACAVMLALTLAAATGALWPAAVVATLWAAHPLQVESVAWVTERSMLLAALLLWATVGAHVRYTRRPDAGRYLIVFLGTLLGLLAKPIFATVPALLLILDWWPLGRLRPASTAGGGTGGAGRLPFVEKVPLLLLCVAFGLLAVRTQAEAGSVASLGALPVADRIGNALRGYAWYLGKSLRPSGLGVYYPLAAGFGSGMPAAAAALLLGAATAAALRARRRRPHLLAGWLWFAVVLAPVSGLLQAGGQATADRFMYVPLAGLLVAAVWSLPGADRGRIRAWPAAAVGIAALALGAVSWAQARFWRDELTLFARAFQVGGGESSLVRHRLAKASLAAGDPAAAERHYREAVRLKPGSAAAEHGLARALEAQGKRAEALRHLRAAVLLFPRFAEAQRNLGAALEREGKPREAEQAYLAAVRADPSSAESYRRLAALLDAQGRPSAASVCSGEARRLASGSAGGTPGSASP